MEEAAEKENAKWLIWAIVKWDGICVFDFSVKVLNVKNQVYCEGSSALMNNPYSALVTDLGIHVLFAANTQHLSTNLASNKYFQYYIQSYLHGLFKIFSA